MPRATLYAFLGALMLCLLPSLVVASTQAGTEGGLLVSRAAQLPQVDGVADDAAWAAADWHPIDQRWLGEKVSPDDFSGRFKVVWTPERIYLLVEIVDDVLVDSHRDPLLQYWDDDCLEIFLDEDFSGGEHRASHNAFAYHLSLDNRAVDIGQDGRARDYSHHVQSRWRQSADSLLWEVSIQIFDDSYDDEHPQSDPVRLEAGKVMGLMVAYCDNDGSDLRENFFGSQRVETGEKDRGYIDAGIFAKIELTE